MLCLMRIPGEITVILEEIRNGQTDAIERLIPLVYQDLRRIAVAYMKRQPPGHTLQPTALVHEAYLRLIGPEGAGWQDREHFFASAGCVMRHLLVDHARARSRLKRGGGERLLPLEDAPNLAASDPDELLQLDSALSRLACLDARAAQVVELRCFLGLDLEETAAALGISERTVKRDWKLAKAWLQAELRSGGEGN